MKILKCLFLLLLIPFFGIGVKNNLKADKPESNVDIVAKKLKNLSAVYYNHWKKSPNLSVGTVINGDPTSENFDDSDWGTLDLEQRVSDDSCWLRKEIVLPERILGQSVKGELKLLLSVDDYGYLWINGKKKGYFPWDGDFVLTKHAQPGEKFLITIKVINNGGPLRLLRAEL
ncbi:MAG: hypothetical protein P8Z35_19120, partial [Ignavibacteriaceae bacterium]